MLCVISYWVLSGAKRRQIQQLRCCAFPAKLLKRRNVYLKLTRHNGRAGAHGTYNPKHNDRSFNLANSEHIDPERAKSNIYWDYFHGFRSALDPQDPNDLAATFSDVERQFYETHYTAFVESQNERNAKIRHTERNRSIPDLLSSRKTCPEETIYQLGTLDEHASAEDLLSVVTEFIEAFKAKYQLLQSDGDFKSVQGNTGHATASVLMDTYAHTQDKPRLELTEKIEANFYSQDLAPATPQPRQNEKPAATKISGKEILEAIRLMDADERRELTRALFA